MLLILAMLALNVSGFAQSAINPKVGIINREFTDEADSGNMLVHFGQSYGFDMIVEDTRFMFMPGLHYQTYGIIGNDSRGSLFEKRESIHQISLPVSFGTSILASPWSKLRVYGGGHINFIVGVDKNDAGINIDRVTLVHPGWQVGAQVMLWKITADVRYYRDYRKVINVREDSTQRGWEFLVGIAF